MIGASSDALINRASARISETAPGRTPIAAARPPVVLPGFARPRSIILISSMALSFPNFRNDSNSDYPKSSLTLISEYQKLYESFRRARPGQSGIQIDHARGDSGFAYSRPGMTPAHAPATQESEKHRNAIDKLDAGAFKRAAGISRQGHVLFGDRGGDQREIQHRLYPPRRDRPRQAIGACQRGPPRGLVQAASESPPTRPAKSAGTLRFLVRMDHAGFRTRRDRQAPLCRNRPAPSDAAGARARRLPLSLWRRRGGRSHHLLRPAVSRRLKLLHAAFSSHARLRQAVETGGPDRPAEAFGGGRTHEPKPRPGAAGER